MNSGEIRQRFLDFFKSKQHQIVPSAPLVLKNDPTLLFANSGMVQFKDYFLGHAVPSSVRIADTQKCLRVSGKHNDLEDVGLDTYHHTMFEMLGNWSFGDYFKKEAIEWAWELLTDIYKLPEDRLYVSVFGGDETDRLPEDSEARAIWKNYVSDDRIISGKKKDNFWEMGETGPCGPCSEIHIDLRSDEERKKKSGHECVNADHPEVVEIWNLVFMQFNRLASGVLEPLPEKHVDTGMGFERLCMAVQGKKSNYDTDVFTPLIDFICQEAKIEYGKEEKTDIAVRVVADHVRAVAFAIADGQIPSNTGAGYVIRRILRRAVRYGYSCLNLKEAFIYKLVAVLGEQMKVAFPELAKQKEYTANVIFQEEQSFLLTLDKGLKRIDQTLKELNGKKMSGATAFELFDTFGFPFDLTQLIARENGVIAEEKEFESEMEKQRARSKADAVKETGDWTILNHDKSEFIGYDHKNAEAHITRYRKVKQKDKELYQIALSQTPFYAESGGQAGDTGVLEAANGNVQVLDTKKENDLIIHLTTQLPKGKVKAQIDEERRQRIMCNHSATHLLHAALRTVLGKHVEQKGSLVNEKMLRFDFSHFAAMKPEEMRQTEQMVNQKIRENILLTELRNVPIEEAKSKGAMALFGEKYGALVRMIIFDEKYSIELCGGTHVPATGQIGIFKLVSESSAAAGVRRIEAVTGAGAEEFIADELDLLREIKVLLKNPRDAKAAVTALLDEKKRLEKKAAEFGLQQAMQWKTALADKAKKENGHTLIIEKINLPSAEALKHLAHGLRHQFDDLLMCLVADVSGKPMAAIMIGETLAKTNRYHAGNLVNEIAKEIDGKGGGQPFFATAAGNKLEGLDKAAEKARKLLV